MLFVCLFVFQCQGLVVGHVLESSSATGCHLVGGLFPFTSLPGNLHPLSKAHLLQNIICHFKGHNSVWASRCGRPITLSKNGNGERHMMMSRPPKMFHTHLCPCHSCKGLHKKTCVLYLFYNVKLFLGWSFCMTLIFQNAQTSNAIPPNWKKRKWP